MIITKELESGLAIRSDSPDRRQAELELAADFDAFRSASQNKKALVITQRTNSQGIPYILLWGELRAEYLKFKATNDKSLFMVNKLEQTWGDKK